MRRNRRREPSARQHVLSEALGGCGLGSACTRRPTARGPRLTGLAPDDASARGAARATPSLSRTGNSGGDPASL